VAQGLDIVRVGFDSPIKHGLNRGRVIRRAIALYTVLAYVHPIRTRFPRQDRNGRHPVIEAPPSVNDLDGGLQAYGVLPI
jgi:hypothetical protein